MEYKLCKSDELTHWGIVGMRWGVRRYQNKDGSLTPAGKRRYDAEMEKIKAETKKAKAQLKAKQQTDAKINKLNAAKKNLQELKNKAQKKEPENNETDEQKRERILKDPSAKEVYANRHLFSSNEIGNLYLRLNNEENIKRLIPKEVDPRKARADKFIKEVEDVTAKALVLGKAYNVAATVYNAFSGTDKVSLPKLDLDSLNKGNKETRKQEQKRIEQDREAEKNKAAREAAAKKAVKEQAKAQKAEAKEQAKAQKAEEKAQRQKEREDKRKAEEMKKYEDFQREYAKSIELPTKPKSVYNNKGVGQREYANPNEDRRMTVYKNTDSGRSATSDAISNLPSAVSRVSNKTTSRGESYATKLLAGDDAKYTVYDRDGSVIGNWSGRKDDPVR